MKKRKQRRYLGKGGEQFVLGRIGRRATNLVRQRLEGVRVGIGDDAAVWRTRRGYETILTCDWFVEGMHFLRHKHPADAVGWKCLARAVSDIAAMGGEPRCFLLSLAVPSSHTGRWLEEFLGGLRRASREFGCALAGGDTTRDARILINITVAGEARTGRAVLRSGARPGDVLFVSGRLGEAEQGLRLLRRGKFRARDGVLRKHLYPQPRLALGKWLAEKRLATAMMDLSDGLSTDLKRLCEASGVGARIEEENIPFPAVPAGASRREALNLALHGGDDYELLFTVAKRQVGRVPQGFRGVPLTAIGEMTRQPGLVLGDASGRRRQLTPRGWDPFRKRR